VSALGHYLEEEGIATVAIGLVRPQIEKTRALWVPFELGRPFGPPADPAFQKRVILAALRLLERRDGPLVIADFPADDPRRLPDPQWRPPPTAAALDDEIALLDNSYRRSVTARGGTTVGLSTLPMAAVGGYAGAWRRGESPARPVAGMSPPLALRFAVDDLKAYCPEAGLAGG
jgi:hypothetical protein